MRTRWAACCCTGLALALGGCALLSPVEVAGTWIGERTWAPGDPMAGFTSSLGLVLEQTGVKITGYLTIAGPGATSVIVPITTGRARVSGFEIRCDETVDVAGTPQAIELELDGTRDGNTLSGTGQETIGGMTHSFDWTAELSTPPPAP